ncbi:hypothetical protein ACSRUE_40570 [Sorangium sp. KYC3313]|uniref:hypothetical protein n=1 Tax=Sorangium sp. KYC3313 TaxID=3449740 RepID=UPI003F8B3917
MSARNGPVSCAPRASLAIAGGLAGWLAAGAAAAQAPPRNAQAEAALKEAMEIDYLETRFAEAERKLRAALDACGESGCSPAVKARLLVALGTVLAQSREGLEDARSAFADALRADPSAKLDPDLTTQEVSSAFEQARAATGAGATGSPAAAGAAAAAGATGSPVAAGAAGSPGSPGAHEGPEAAEAQLQIGQCLDDRQCDRGFACVGGACVARAAAEAAPEVRRSWVALTFSPDVALLSGRDVCTVASQRSDHFVCLRGDGTRYDGTPTPGVANDVNLGFALATLRVAIAYDRLVLDNLTVGGRVGFAAGGTTEGGASFLPLHLEARAQYFLGARPFEQLGARPFVLAAAGVAQVDAEVDVEVLEDATACGADLADRTSPCTRPGASGRVEARRQTLTATRQAGQGFASVGAGVAYAPIEALSLNLALRASLTFPAMTTVLSPEVGLSLGF